MTLDTLRSICRALPEVTEDVKWGADLCFCVRKKMFVAVNLEPPHPVAFKCSPESFGELIERPGIIPAPYMARNMWVQELELGQTLDRRELEALVRQSYQLVVDRLPKSQRPGAPTTKKRPGSGESKGSMRRAPDSKTANARRLKSLKVSAGFRSFVLDQLEALGDVTPRAMFGGVGLYHRGVFFGILARDTLYLKVGDSNLADYERAGMKAFKPYVGDGPGDRVRRRYKGTMKYHAVPLDVLESAPELAAWARKAVAVAASPPPSPRRRPRVGAKPQRK